MRDSICAFPVAQTFASHPTILLRSVRKGGQINMQPKTTIDVLIIGAGAAGLAAWRELHSTGLNAAVLEARDRIGGRIFTDHSTPSPVELGAEFVHGKANALCSMLDQARLDVLE